MPAHGVMFYHFYDDAHPRAQGAIDAGCLRRLLKELDVSRILPAREWLARGSRGGLKTDDMCLTFDDALRCQYDIALPVLREFGLTGFWFVYSSVFEGAVERLELDRYFRNTSFATLDAFYDAFEDALASSADADEVDTALSGFVAADYLAEFAFYTERDRTFRFLRDGVLGPERYAAVMDAMIERAGLDVATLGPRLWMDDDCLRALDREGHVVGLHSFSHPTAMADLPRADQAEEYQRNATHLARVLGAAPEAMAHPSNSYNTDTLEVLSDLGVKIGFRANMDGAAKAPFEFPREDHIVLVERFGLT